MLIALMADIHANREAFEACLAEARARRVEKFVFLGDYVGYGADPEWVVQKLMELTERGALAVQGNHDAAVGGKSESMDGVAQLAMEWTRIQLGQKERSFLAKLSTSIEDEGRLYVHSEAVAPSRWTYVTSAPDAARSMKATRSRVTFCGHVHRAAIYSMSEVWNNVSEMWRVTPFRPASGTAIPLMSQRRWLSVVGSVGQPRDGNPAASWTLLDTERNEVNFLRTPYHVETACAKIVAAGLPGELAERLRRGR